MKAGPFLVSHKRYAPGFRQALHEHPIAAIDLNIRGNGEGRYHRTQRVSRAGEVEYFHAGVPHSFVAGPSGIRTLHVTFDLALAANLGLRPAAETLPDQPAATGAAASILRELSDPDASSPLAIEECAVRMLAATFRFGEADRSSPRWVQLVRERLAAGSSERFSLRELAADVGVDRAHLARTFRASTGLTCGEYHRLTRIAAAQRLLASGDLPLTRVAHMTGFSDQAHLTRWFRRAAGWTPARFAMLMRKDTPEP